MQDKPFIIKKDIIGAGKYIRIEKIFFQDERRRERVWEGCARQNSHGAVIIVPKIVPDNEYILGRQFRPPAGRYIIEFPAGLIDEGETAAVSAPRELYEETGYEGKIVRVFDPGFSSPGLSGETATFVFMEIDGGKYRDIVPETHQEDSENIEVFRVKADELYDFLLKAIASGDGVDSKLWPFVMNVRGDL